MWAERTRQFRRHHRNRVIRRKKDISRQVYGIDWYSCDGKYSKGKVHCGCGLCKWGRKYGAPTVRDERDSIKLGYDIGLFMSGG